MVNVHDKHTRGDRLRGLGLRTNLIEFHADLYIH